MTTSTIQLPRASKKLSVAALGGLIIAFNNRLGFGLGPEAIEALTVIVSAFCVGQGVADFGKGKIQAEKAVGS